MTKGNWFTFLTSKQKLWVRYTSVHSPVDSSTPSILRPRVQTPNTASML